MRRVTLALVLLSAAAVLAGCRANKPPAPPPPKPSVTAIRPVAVPVSDYWTYNGYLETSKAVEVRSKIRGFLAKVMFTEGTEVNKDDPLYEIDKLEFQTAASKAEAEEKKAEADIVKAEAEIKNWEAQIVEARIELERVKRAVASGGESETAQTKAQALYDVRIAERDAAKATRDAAKSTKLAASATLRTANIQLGYTDIKAKIGGRISRTLVDEGNLVLADTTVLTTIVKVDELFVYFDAPEADLLAYQQGLIAARRKPMSAYHQAVFAVQVAAIFSAQHVSGPGLQIPFEVGVGKENGYAHKGYIDFRENRVDTGTGTIRIRGVIPNPIQTNNDRLLFPGMYARVRVPRGDATNQLAIPEDCLLSAQEGQFVYVIGKDNKVQKRMVSVGATVWKAPPAVPGEAPPSWVAVNPNPPPAKEGQPPPSSRRPIRSVVAVAFHKPLAPDERVILEGLQKPKPGDEVAPEEWTLTPPANGKP